MINRQLGLSLIEILVALVISTFLLGGVIQVYSGNKATYGFSEAMSRIQENGRYAMDIILRDLRMAGFRGCATDQFVNNLDPNGTGYDADQHDYFSNPPVEGEENNGTNNSDTLFIRGAAPGQSNIVTPYNNPTSATVFVNNAEFIEDGDIVLIANCRGADLFQITNMTKVSSSNYSIVHNSGVSNPGPGNYNPGNCTGGNAHCLSQTYGGDSALLKMQTVRYRIGVGDSGEPALFRAEFSDESELVDGIEQMQILYGVNTDTDDTSPNQYVSSDNVADWDEVTAVRIMLLLRSTDTVNLGGDQKYRFNGVDVTANDNRLRQVFSTTIALRNRI